MKTNLFGSSCPRSECVEHQLLYVVEAQGTAPAGSTDPIYRHPVEGMHRYRISRLPGMEDYVDRLVIDWGPGMRSWVQRADRGPKPVLAIRDPADPPFPGFTQFVCDIDDVAGLYGSWQQILRAVKGV